jgi:hypothetical protein
MRLLRIEERGIWNKSRDNSLILVGKQAKVCIFVPFNKHPAMKFYGVEALLMLAAMAGMLGMGAGFEFIFATRPDQASYQRKPFWHLVAAFIPFGTAVAGIYLAQANGGAYRSWVDLGGIPLGLLALAGGYWVYRKQG